jgi:vacuolar protein sorting-associated protein 26
MWSVPNGGAELFYDRGNHFEFTSLLKELAPPGILTASEEFPFEFSNVEKLHESYNGINVRLRWRTRPATAPQRPQLTPSGARYFVKFTIVRQYSSNITKEQEFWVQKTAIEPEINNSIKMEVGIEDCLHIEFEYNKSKWAIHHLASIRVSGVLIQMLARYHLKDVVVGKIYFLLVRIKIKHMELAIIRRESTGSGGPTVKTWPCLTVALRSRS